MNLNLENNKTYSLPAILKETWLSYNTIQNMIKSWLSYGVLNYKSKRKRLIFKGSEFMDFIFKKWNHF
jgi:hypothetical protein